MMQAAWMTAVLAGLFLFGWVLYRAGRNKALLTHYKKERKTDEQVDKVLARNSVLRAADVLDWLRRLRGEK